MTPIDPMSMFNNSRSFLAAARQLIAADFETEAKLRHPESAIVLGALAAEIALKGVLCLERRIRDQESLRKAIREAKGNGHDLAQLFSMLTDRSKARTQREFLRLQPEHSDHMFKGRTVSDLVHNIFAMAETVTFTQMLKQHAESFERWRYNHESARLSGGTTFVLVLADAVLSIGPQRSAGAPAAQPDSLL